MMESIEKLRESSHLDDDKWTFDDGVVMRMYGSEPNEPGAVNWGEQWRKIADEIEAEIERNYVRLPWGWESEQAASVLAYWPTWDDGSPCMFGDEFTCYPKYDLKNEYEVFDRLVIFGPNHVWSRGCDDEKPHDGGYYEWNFMRPGGDGCEAYRPTKRKPRTIEDVLREFAEKAVCGNQYGSLYADEEEIAKYAVELRELLGGDA